MNLRTFCFRDYHYALRETLCLVTLAYYIVVFYSNLYFYASHTYFAPFLCFSHILVLNNYFICITPRAQNIFLIPDI